jgi:hypothetical protein
MLLLFGKYKDPARAIGGIALLVFGIIAHVALLAAGGAVLLAWGSLRLLSAWRRSR